MYKMVLLRNLFIF